VGALGTGSGVSKALAKFGETAVARVVEAASSDQPDRSAVTDAMLALQYMLEGGMALSGQSRDKIRAVAHERPRIRRRSGRWA
jgi:hypothetical protein